MGNGAGTAPAMEGIQASTSRLNALFFEDSALEAGGGAGAGVDVLQRRYELCLERMAVAKQLEAQIAAVKAGDAAEGRRNPARHDPAGRARARTDLRRDVGG